MLNLKILDFFDYAGKLDSDVSFVAPFPEPNLPRRMVNTGAMMLATQKEWYFDDPRISQGVRSCLDAYVAHETSNCANSNFSPELIPRGMRNPFFWESSLNVTFRAHFLVYWLGLYTSPGSAFDDFVHKNIAFTYYLPIFCKRLNILANIGTIGIPEVCGTIAGVTSSGGRGRYRCLGKVIWTKK
jgi:hypothetical protein